MISACRVGNARVVGFMGQRWESALDRSARKPSAEVLGNALRAQKTLSALYAQGYTLATDGADTLLGKVIVLAGKDAAVKVAAAKRVTPFRKARARKAS